YRILRLLLHVVIYFSPLFWMILEQSQFQLICCIIYGSVSLISLFLCINRDFTNTSVHLKYIVDEYFCKCITHQMKLRAESTVQTEIEYLRDASLFQLSEFQQHLYMSLLRKYHTF